MSTVVAIAVLVLLGTCAAWIAVRSALRAMRDESPLRLSRLVEGKGLALAGARSEAEVRSAALAARRCATCASHARCDVHLDARDYDGLRDICPNTLFIDRLAK